MSKIIIRHSDGLQVVNSHVHVQACLDVVPRHPLLLELLCSPAHRKRQGLVLLRNPASLDTRLLLLISLLFLVLAEHSCDRLDRLFQLDLSIVSGRQLVPCKLRLSPIPRVDFFLRPKLGLELGDVVRILFLRWVLWEGRLKVRSIHQDLPFVFDLLV